MLDLNKFISQEEMPQQNNANNMLPLLMNYLSQQRGMQQQPAQQDAMPGEEVEPQRGPQLGQGAMMPQGPGLSWGELKKLAEMTYPDSPILQKVALAQVNLESGNPENMSALAKKGGLFGIKGNGANMQTTEYINGQPVKMAQGFQTSGSPLEAFMKYKQLLEKPRYANVMKATTPQEAFSALQQAHYATDPKYSEKLNALYSKNIEPLFGDKT